MFQSLIGRLQTFTEDAAVVGDLEIQSIIGRLQTYIPQNDFVEEIQFQSLIGRLQTDLVHIGRNKLCDVSIPHR